MQRERKLAALRRALKQDGWVKGDEVIFKCTYSKGCNGRHHKDKLQVNLQSDIFHCWVCGWKGGSLLPILRKLGDQDPDYVDYAAEHDKNPNKDIGGKVYETVRLPKEFQTLSRPTGSPYFRQAIAYLTQRGITSEDILDYKLGYCEEGQYKDRVIVPSFDEYGELTFFVGRGIWERIAPPYLSGKFDKDIIFNDLMIDWSKPITLVEGPFDAFKAGMNAIPLQGKLPSKKLLSKIYRLLPKTYVALDQDAGPDMLKIAGDLVSNGVETLVVNWPKQDMDPGACTKAEFEEIRNRAVPVVSMADIMKQRVYHSSSMGHA